VNRGVQILSSVLLIQQQLLDYSAQLRIAVAGFLQQACTLLGSALARALKQFLKL